MKLGAMLGEGLPERSPHLYEWPFLLSSISIHSRADVTSEYCASDKPGPTRLAPSANHAREIAGSRALVCSVKTLAPPPSCAWSRSPLPPWSSVSDACGPPPSLPAVAPPAGPAADGHDKTPCR